MVDTQTLNRWSRSALERLLPRIRERLEPTGDDGLARWSRFSRQVRADFEPLFELLHDLYGDGHDFYFHLEGILEEQARAVLARPAELLELDDLRRAEPDWFLSHQQMGGVCYVDRFADDLAGLSRRLPYLEGLGLTYLHLMPLLRCPEGENDGGYAVSSFREVDPRLGDVDDLRSLAGELRSRGISLCLDFVFNHTSDEHEWARRARAGEAEFQDCYRMFPDRTLPDRYEERLREIFPDERRGSFTWSEEAQRWVWTTFHSYQWDLNYANPDVFRRMLAEMLFLANLGVEVLRLDAVAFVWKRLGTVCENLPEAHLVIRAFNAAVRIATPAMVFKSEAIVHPDEVVRYISPEECPLSYNPLLMALLWNSLATRKTRLLSHSMAHRFEIPAGCSWVNYLRCHDDIGWTFDDGDAARLGIEASPHRDFLNEFYLGRFEGSFARGLPFQAHPETGDCRVSGTLAALAGLEKARLEGDAEEIDRAIARILLLHSVVLSIGGVPLIYLGDELGTENDYGYKDDPTRARDSRWVHRPRHDWEAAALAVEEPGSIPGRIYQGIARLTRARKQCPSLAAGEATRVLDVENPHVFAYVRGEGAGAVLLLHSFSEHRQEVPARRLANEDWAGEAEDLLTGARLDLDGDLVLEPYQGLWLVPR